MELIIENLKSINYVNNYTISDLWKSMIKNTIYEHFSLAIKEENNYIIKNLLTKFKEYYHIEFLDNVTVLDLNLLNKYNKLNNTNYKVKDNEIANISNFGFSSMIVSKANKSVNGIIVNTPSIRYFFSYLMLKKYIIPDKIILEIGCCSSAGVACQILKYHKHEIKCLLLCDIFEVLLFTYSVLQYNFPNLKIHFFDNNENKNIDELIKDNNIILIPPENIHYFSNCEIEFCFNSYSLSEMTINNINEYFEFLKKTCIYFISENRQSGRKKGIIQLNDYYPKNFIKINETINCNCDDGNHNIYHFKIN